MTESTTAAPPPSPVDPTVPPPAPRELTPRARRAAWAHPTVRFWWLVAVALLLGMAYLAVAQTIVWLKDVRLVESGAEVDAIVFDAGGNLKNKPIPPQANVDLTYTYEGKQYKVTGALSERKGTLFTGQTMRVRIDPENPKVWTNCTEPPSLLSKMFPPLLMAPPLAVAVGAGAFLRRRVATLWATGEARRAVAVASGQTPLAPLSQAVRCTLLPPGGDKRLITVYVPQRRGKVSKGQTLWLVTHPKNPQRALAAAAFL